MDFAKFFEKAAAQSGEAMESLVQGTRKELRDSFFTFWKKLSLTNEYRSAVHEAGRGSFRTHEVAAHVEGNGDSPYSGLGTAASQPKENKEKKSPVFITARFRSGSTFLWSLFREYPGAKAFYEPFNERRWFDPAVRGAHVDGTHRGVSDYWKEYQGLEGLGRYYNEEWIDTHLFMDKNFWDPRMKRYIEELIHGGGEHPILQFNRADFRLPWLRGHFPEARILHLYRHPREQWCSSLVDMGKFSYRDNLTSWSGNDHFYLGNWVKDLRYVFPMLEWDISHPYEQFYLLWKLSYLFGKRYADVSIGYERFCEQYPASWFSLLSELGLEPRNEEAYRSREASPAKEKWREYAPESWFQELEAKCEAALSATFPPL